MSKTIAVATAIVSLFISAAQAADPKPVVFPPAPKPVPTTLPLNAQVTPGNVYVPISKSGNTGISFGGLKNPLPGEVGGTVSLTIKTK